MQSIFHRGMLAKCLRLTLPSAAALAGLLAVHHDAYAQQALPANTWKPDHTVTLVVPYAPGGGTDTTARAIARSLATVWKQPVVVENIPGADGLIGSRRAMESRPDGHTLILQVPSVALVKYQPSLNGVDPFAHLAPITAVADTPPAFVSTSQVPATTLDELIAYCKTAPKPCVFGTGERSAKLMASKFAKETGLTNLIVVNYRGTAAIVPDLISGNVTVAYTGITAALPHHKNGSVRILSTVAPKRAPMLPDVPTIREAGLPSFEAVTWYGLFAAKDTPSVITHAIADAVRLAGQDTDVRRTLETAGAVPVMNTPEDFAQQVEFQRKRYGDLAREFPLE